jgi:putative hydrolase of the HAD superfamily
MTIETVVFDLDDTLVAAGRAYARALSVLVDYHIDAGTFLAAHRRWWASYQRGECTIEELYQGRMRDAGLTGAMAATAHDQFVRAAATVCWRPGAKPLLQTLRSRQVKTVILTNGGSRIQRAKLAQLDADKLVDAVLISEEIGQVKPAAAAFHAALNAVTGRATAAAAVGDDLHADVEGALAADFGMAIWVTADRRTVPGHRIAKVRRLDQVTAILGMPNA